jgi:hypothetical protein
MRAKSNGNSKFVSARRSFGCAQDKLHQVAAAIGFQFSTVTTWWFSI